MSDFETETKFDLYELWVEAQKPITDILKADSDCFRIGEKIEIYKDEVKLKGKASSEALENFIHILDKSVRILDEGLSKLDELLHRVNSSIATAESLEGIEHRFRQMKEMEACCSELKTFLQPVLNGKLAPLVDPRLFILLQQLDKLYGGGPSSRIVVTVKQTYLI